MPYQPLGAGLTTSSNPATVPLSAPANHDVWLLATAPAYLNTPAGWTLVDTFDTLPGWGSTYIFRLPTAGNPSGLASVAVSWSGGARRVAYVAWADDPATNIYGKLDNGFLAPTTSNPALWGAGAHTFTTRSRAFGFYSTVQNVGTVITGQIVSADNGFAVAQQVGTVPSVAGEEAPWIGAVRKDNHAFSADGVVATLNGTRASTGLYGSNGSGMLAYDVPAGSAPGNTVAPAVTGTTVVGQTLTCSQGTWTNSPTSYAYQWKRDGVAISGATSATYLLVSADAQASIKCTVTATNANGSTPVDSNSVNPTLSGPVAWRSSGPANPHAVPLGGPPAGKDIWIFALSPGYMDLPTNWVTVVKDQQPGGEAHLMRLPGVQNPGGLMSVNLAWPGAARTLQAIIWSDDPVEAGTVYANLATQSATGATPALWGSRLHTFPSRSRNFALWASLIYSGNSSALQIVSVDSSHSVWGQTTTPPLTFSEDVAGYVGITKGPDPSAMSNNGVTATLPSAVGPLQMAVSFTGMFAYDVTVSTAPVNTVAPAVTGTASVGQTLTCSTGTWTNSPTSYAYQWKRAGVAISGATSSTYLLAGADAGQSIKCTVTATNAGGSNAADSNTVTLSGGAKLSIAQENALTGESLGQVTISGAGDPANQGFARPFSNNVGDTVNFACHGDGTVLDIYRIGYYGGGGWSDRKTRLTNVATSQPTPQSIANSNGGTDCGNWANTCSWAIPANATPGLYVGVLRNAALNNGSYVPFVVRDDARPAAIMYKTADATWALAYNYFDTPASPFTGKSLYGSGGPMGSINTRSHVASYDKPIVTRQGINQTYWMACEFPIIRYLERMGLDVTYTACKDWREGSSVTPAACSVYISPGHDEYWDQGMRDKWIALRDAGKHLLFMSGNEVFWRTRFTDGGTRMWCYKDTMTGPGAHVGGTALDPVSWTGTWKDTRWASRAPENLITGTDFRMNGVNDRSMVIPAGQGSHPFWRSTDVNSAGLTVPAIVGFEADEMKGTQPAASQKILAATVIDATGIYADDNGENYSGTDATMQWGVLSQRYASGAVVVGFGTCQWGWGLDGTHDRGANVASSRVQQATYNLLRDLGVPVGDTPIAGLTAPTPQSLDVYGENPAGGGTAGARLWRSHAGAWEEILFEGTEGPAGATGPAGPTGPAGAAGAAGAAGQGVPTGGTSGQVLAKTSATDFATSWVAQDGAILAGTGVPAAGTGKDGDLYIRTGATPTLYRKASGAWTTQIGGAPAGGSNGQVLAKTAGTDYAVGWTNPATAATWTALTAGTNVTANAAAYKSPQAIVFLKRELVMTGAQAAGNTLATLPAGMFPLNVVRTIALKLAGAVMTASPIAISTAGVITSTDSFANGDSLFLDGLSLPST